MTCVRPTPLFDRRAHLGNKPRANLQQMQAVRQQQRFPSSGATTATVTAVGRKDLSRARQVAAFVLLSLVLTGCPDSVDPKKPSPGPHAPDAPRVPEPKLALPR